MRVRVVFASEKRDVSVKDGLWMCVCVCVCVVCGRVLWKSPAQGLFFNSTSKEQITSNKRGYDCDLHCSCSVTKHNEHSSPENKTIQCEVFSRSSF